MSKTTDGPNAALLILIERLESAPQGSEELDRAVGEITGRGFYERALGSYHFTRGIGDALSLIDRNLGVTFHRFLGQNGRSWATVFSNHPDGTPRPAGTLARPEWTCSANTEALALCAAALKARMEP